MLPKSKAEAALEMRLSKASKAPNYLTMVLRAHFAIEQLLNAAIRKHLQSPSREIERLTFSLKIELVAAFGIIPKPSLPLFRQFNALRNKLAHNPFASLLLGDIRSMATSLSELQRAIVKNGDKNEPLGSIKKREFLWRCILAMYVELDHQVREKNHHDIKLEILMKRLVLAASKLPKQSQIAADREVDEAIAGASIL
ncbi:MAG: hypothetical protein Q8Q73_04515 [Stagnimonas sp.]|nr:hypothetical protein [Stagnimonas sp.]